MSRRAGFGQSPVDDIEQHARRVGAGAERRCRRRIRHDAGGDAGQGAGHAGEVAADLLLESSRGRLVIAAEPPELDRRASDCHDQGREKTAGKQTPGAHVPLAQRRGERGGH